MSHDQADDLLIVAGEASGDLHGARLLAELSARVPGLSAFGLGGDELRQAGCEILAESREISVVGISEVLKILPRAKQIFAELLDAVELRGTRTAVLIDFPDFNLRLAKQLHRRGVRVIYYISPQVWAWRRGRVKNIRRTVEKMLVLFGFEEIFYRQHGVAVTHVGHPLVDEVPQLQHVWEQEPEGAAPPSQPVIALLPGSRASEVRSILPAMLESVSRIAQQWPVTARLIQAPSVDPEIFEQCLQAVDFSGGQVSVDRVRTDRFEAIAQSHLALCASGTATLEVGLLGTPMLVLYRLKWGSYWLGRLLVKLPHFSLVNLVLEKGVVPELLQQEAAPLPVSKLAMELLQDRSRIDRMRRSLDQLRTRLGVGGASARAAAEIAPLLLAKDPPGGVE